jgi:hypothetical protein
VLCVRVVACFFSGGMRMTVMDMQFLVIVIPICVGMLVMIGRG